MCGIAGVVNKNKEIINRSLLFSMSTSLSHRGPDDEKFLIFNSKRSTWHLFKRGKEKDFKGDIGFAHRRLSIIDLSDSGSQPMADEEKKIWIIHNGEIFNYLELREELIKLGYKFTTHSDTEVIINAYRKWGRKCLEKFNGMWAFVIYDTKKNIIWGARDRFGIKPLYYHISPEYFSFASEIKALLRLPWVSKSPFLPAIKDYLFYSRTSTSKYTFFKDLHELEAGHFFEIDLSKGFSFCISRWWDLTENLYTPPEKESETAEKFRDLLLSSVRLRLRSDVPIGTCLSGGLDSSAVISLANPNIKQGNQKAFSIVHPGFKYDESQYIEEIEKKYRLTSYKTSINGKGFLEEMENLFHSHDEPFTSTSVYAQWKVFQLAKQNEIKVTLDGQGADELLAGYPYFKMVYWSELLQRMKILDYFNEIQANSKSIEEILLNIFMSFSGFFPHRKMISLAGIKSPQYSLNWINKKFFDQIPPLRFQIKKKLPSKLNQRLYEVFTFDGLPALLRYADRNSMAHGLEARMPFLDHKFVTYVFSLSSEAKINKGQSKYILRKALESDIPKKILRRKDKIGFETPEALWFRNEMSRMISDIIHSRSIEKRGFYKVNNLRKIFEEHKRGSINISRPIWRVINLELWLRKHFD